MKAFKGQSNFAGAGDYRDIITILAPTYNSPADEVTGYTPLTIVGSSLPAGQTWANVEPAMIPPGRNLNIQVEEDREISIQDVLIRLRYMPGVTMTTVYRILHESTTYTIRNVADVGSRKREWHLTCRAVA